MQDKEISRTRQSCKTSYGRNKSSKCKAKGIKVQEQGVVRKQYKKTVHKSVEDKKKQGKGARLDIAFKGTSQRCKT